MRKFEAPRYFVASLFIFCALVAWAVVTRGGRSSISGLGGRVSRVIAAAGIGDNPLSDSTLIAGARSGSRLVATYYVGEDGSKQYGYFTDSKLDDEPCAFATAADGAVRCLPAAGATAGGLFSDSTCSRPLAVSDSPSCPLPRYARQSAGNRCGPALVHIYPVEGVYTGTFYGMEASSTGGARCTALPTPYVPSVYTAAPSSAWTLLSLSDEIPPATFALATVQAQ